MYLIDFNVWYLTYIQICEKQDMSEDVECGNGKWENFNVEKEENINLKKEGWANWAKHFIP